MAHLCLMPEHHADFLDSFIYTGITSKAIQALEANGVEYNQNIIHFPKGGIHPGHGRKLVMFPDENNDIQILRHWRLPDGTVLRHSTEQGYVDLDVEENM